MHDYYGYDSPVFRITVPESFSKRIASNFELGDSVVLVGSHGCKLSLGKYKGFEVFSGGIVLVFPVVVNDVKPRLISMHRVKYYLPNINVDNIPT